MGEEMKHSPIACPDPARWLEMAAGTGSPEIIAGLTEHAAGCAPCASQLREAIRVMAEEGDAAEDTFVAALDSSQPDWQKEMARQLGGRRTAVPWWKRRSTWAVAAIVVVAASGTLLVPRRAPPRVAVEGPAVLIASVTLDSMMTRDLGSVPSLQMKPGAEWADITLQSVDGLPRQLLVQFLDVAEREVWRTELVLSDADAALGKVTVRLPASKLPEGEYHISAGPVTGGSGKHASFVFRATY
jgi:hypothetical protein